MKKSRLSRIEIAALIVAAIFACLFLGLTILVKNDVFVNLNREIYDAIASLINPFLTGAMIAVSYSGEWYVWLGLALILSVFAKTRPGFGWPTLLATLASGALAIVTKDLFQIARPHIHWLVQEVGYGFPSGHAAISTAFVATFLYFFLCSRSQKPWKIFVAVVAILWIITISFSRIYLGVHSSTDVLSGIFAGIFVAAAVIFTKEIWRKKVRQTWRQSRRDGLEKK